MATTKRITMTIPNELVEDLNFISLHLGLSRSGLMSEILLGSSKPMREVIEACLGDNPTDGKPLKRNPETIRNQLSSIITAIEQQKSDLSLLRDNYIPSEGSYNEH